MDRQIITRRIKAIRNRLTRNDLDSLILTKPANVTYTTAFMGADSWALITKRQTYLLTDSRYTEQAKSECRGCRIVERAETLPQTVAMLVAKSHSIKSVALEQTTSLADFNALKKHLKRTPKAVDRIVEAVRRQKDTAEIKTIKAAGAIANRALKQTIPHIKPDITEIELAGLLDLQMRTLGATTSFDTIVAFGPNASRPHHQPGMRKLKKNDTILIDFGARYKGYCSDITRCFIVGRPTKLYRKVFEVVELAQAAAIAQIKAGAMISDVDAAARNVIEKADLPVYGHGTGHGLGLEIHEDPFLKPEAKGTLEPGHIITIEPGVYMPGKLGVRIEDDVLVTKTGREILTRHCSHSPILPA